MLKMYKTADETLIPRATVDQELWRLPVECYKLFLYLVHISKPCDREAFGVVTTNCGDLAEDLRIKELDRKRVHYLLKRLAEIGCIEFLPSHGSGVKVVVKGVA